MNMLANLILAKIIIIKNKEGEPLLISWAGQELEVKGTEHKNNMVPEKQALWNPSA